MGKLVLRKTILRNMIDRVWAALLFDPKDGSNTFLQNIGELLTSDMASRQRR
jgi:hypothetical protein